jgi:trigger factor
LNISAEKTEDCQLKLTVEVDQERVDAQLKAAAHRLSNKARIPGFRKGHAPYHIVVSMLGKDAVYDEALEVLGQEVYTEALKSQDFRPYAQAQLDEVTHDPMVLKFTVPLEPEINLNDYRAIRVEPETVEITEEQVEKAVEQARDEKAEWRSVERALAAGDMAYFKLAMTAGGESLFDGEHNLVITPGSSAVGPGFAEAVVGMEKDQNREFDLTYPDTWADEHVSGKTIHFSATLNDVQEKILPELNDEFAALVGDYASLADFRARLREDLQGQEEHAAIHRYEDAAVNKLTEVAQVCYPPLMVEQELDRMMDELDQRIRREQNLGLDDYVKMTHQTKDELRQNLQVAAERRLKQSLVLSELARQEKLTVSDEEIKNQERMLMGAFGENPQAVKTLLSSPQGHAVMLRDVITGKSVARLVAIAKGEAPELPADEPPDKTAANPTSEQPADDAVVSLATAEASEESAPTSNAAAS